MAPYKPYNLQQDKWIPLSYADRAALDCCYVHLHGTVILSCRLRLSMLRVQGGDHLAVARLPDDLSLRRNDLPPDDGRFGIDGTHALE